MHYLVLDSQHQGFGGLWCYKFQYKNTKFNNHETDTKRSIDSSEYCQTETLSYGCVWGRVWASLAECSRLPSDTFGFEIGSVPWLQLRSSPALGRSWGSRCPPHFSAPGYQCISSTQVGRKEGQNTICIHTKGWEPEWSNPKGLNLPPKLGNTLKMCFGSCSKSWRFPNF